MILNARLLELQFSHILSNKSYSRQLAHETQFTCFIIILFVLKTAKNSSVYDISHV